MNYQSMFNNPCFSCHQNKISNMINIAKKTLKKQDRIVWFLRIYRYNLADEQAKKTFYTPNLDSDSSLPLDEILQVIQHYLDMDIYAINKTVFLDVSFYQLRSLFEKHYDVYQKKQSILSREVDEKGTAFLSVGPYTWFNLGVRGCRQEAKSMSHCGNGVGSTGQVVYSLREPSSETRGKWIPRVTLILNGTSHIDDVGFTTEIKGYGNQKPNEKYHDALIAFVTSGRVFKMDGGGYLAQNNFCLDDLSENQQAYVKQFAPCLHPFELHLKESIGTISNSMRSCIASGLYDSDLLPGYIRLFEDKLNVFASDHEMPVLAAYSRIACEDTPEHEVSLVLDQVSQMLDNAFSSSHCFKLTFCEKRGEVVFHVSREAFLTQCANLTKDELFSQVVASSTLRHIDSLMNVKKFVLKKIYCDFKVQDIENKYPHLLMDTDWVVYNQGKLTDDFVNFVINDERSCVSALKPNERHKTHFIEILDGDVSELADDFNMHSLKSFVPSIQQGHFDFHYDSGPFDYDVVEPFIKECIEMMSDHEQKSVFEAFCLRYDVVERPSALLDLIAYLAIEDNDFENQIHCFQLSAYESGAFEQLMSSYNDLTQSLIDEHGLTVLEEDEKILITMSVKSALEIVFKYIKDNHSMVEFNESCYEFDVVYDHAMDDWRESLKIDLQVPYYGYSDFNQSYFTQLFSEFLNEAVVSNTRVAA